MAREMAVVVAGREEATDARRTIEAGRVIGADAAGALGHRAERQRWREQTHAATWGPLRERGRARRAS